MAIAVSSPKLAGKLQELRNLQRSLSSPKTANPYKRSRQKARLKDLHREIRQLLAR